MKPALKEVCAGCLQPVSLDHSCHSRDPKCKATQSLPIGSMDTDALGRLGNRLAVGYNFACSN